MPEDVVAIETECGCAVKGDPKSTKVRRPNKVKENEKKKETKTNYN